MTLARIRVNRHFIKLNAQDGGKRPVYMVKIDGEQLALYAHGISIEGNSNAVEHEGKAWIEARFEDMMPHGGKWTSHREAKNG